MKASLQKSVWDIIGQLEIPKEIHTALLYLSSDRAPFSATAKKVHKCSDTDSSKELPSEGMLTPLY